MSKRGDEEEDGPDQKSGAVLSTAALDSPSLLEEIVSVVNKKDDKITELEKQLEELQEKKRPPAPVIVLPAKTVEAAPAPAPTPLPTPKQHQTPAPPKKTHQQQHHTHKPTILEQAAARPLVRKHSLLVAVVLTIGLFCLVYCIANLFLNILFVGVTWICGSGPDKLPVVAPTAYPEDPYASSMTDKGVFWYRTPSLEENRALHRTCQTPSNFSFATARLVDSGLSTDIQTERGLISLMSLRMSLKRLTTENDYDFICSQLLDLPLCYCMAIVGNEPQTRWLDIVGRVNLTCVSKSATVYSNEWDGACTTQKPRKHLVKRFQTVCVEYDDMRGFKWLRTVSGKEAVVMQQIFEVQRGLSVCDSSLERTLRIVESEARNEAFVAAVGQAPIES